MTKKRWKFFSLSALPSITNIVSGRPIMRFVIFTFPSPPLVKGTKPTVEKTTVVWKMGRFTPDDWEKCRAALQQLFTDILAR